MGEIIKIEYASNDDLSPVTTTDYSQAVNREDGSRAINSNLSQMVLKRIKFPTPYNSDTDILELQVSRDRVNWDNLLSFVGVISIEGTTGLTNSYWEFYDAAHNNRITAGIGLTKYVDEDFIAMRYGQYRAIGGNQQLSNWSDIVNPWYWRVAKKTFANCEDVADYNSLMNKPKINGVELVGNKSFNDLGLDISNYYTKSQVDTALNSKVSGSWKLYTLPTELGLTNSEITSMVDIFKAMPNNSMLLIDFYDADDTFLGKYPSWTDVTPLGKGSFLFVKIHKSRGYVTWYGLGGSTAYGVLLNSSTFSGWKPLATAEPPTKNPLSLASGMLAISTGSCYYYKTQYGQVKVVGCIQKSSALADSNLLATLPSGYRPASVEDRPAFYTNAAGLVRVATNGQITVNFPNISGQTQVYFELEFYAA